jgi:hypothetical protein
MVLSAFQPLTVILGSNYLNIEDLQSSVSGISHPVGVRNGKIYFNWNWD